jgi:hypothetical protein
VLWQPAELLQLAPVFAGTGTGSGAAATHLPAVHCLPLQSILVSHSASSEHGTAEQVSGVVPFVGQQRLLAQSVSNEHVAPTALRQLAWQKRLPKSFMQQCFDWQAVSLEQLRSLASDPGSTQLPAEHVAPARHELSLLQ